MENKETTPNEAIAMMYIAKEETVRTGKNKKQFPILNYDDHSSNHLFHQSQQIQKSAITYCIETYGFASNPALQPWQNTIIALSNTTQFD